MQNKLRIIGGAWRSRQIKIIDAPGLRPTPARVRETLFNWLQYDIAGSRCLDCYAGSGALGFEAASRGARSVVQIDSNAAVCRVLHANAEALGATQIRLRHGDVFRYLADGEPELFDIVFIDPPFGLGLAAQTCGWLEDKGWLASHAAIYLETERGLPLSAMPDTWQLTNSKTAGEVAYRLYRRSV